MIKADDEVAEDKVLREAEELVIATEAQSAVDYDKGVDDILVPITEEESAVPVAFWSKTYISDSAGLISMAKSEKKRSLLATDEKIKVIYGTVVDETGESLLSATITLKEPPLPHSYYRYYPRYRSRDSRGCVRSLSLPDFIVM